MSEIQKLFNRLAKEGDAIRRFRKANPLVKTLPAHRIEWLIMLEKMVQKFKQ